MSMTGEIFARVEGGGGGGLDSPYDGLYEEAPFERGISRGYLWLFYDIVTF